MEIKRDKAPDRQEGLARDTRGLSSVEYLILLVVIAVASITIWQKIGGHVVDHANESEEALRDFKPENAPK